MSFEYENAAPARGAETRPGAMTAVMLAAQPASAMGPRELRIGRVVGGAIVDDRQFRTSLTFGRSEKAALMAPGAAVSCAPLFERSASGAFTLIVPPGARGRLALAAGSVDLAELAGSSIALDAGARGKLVLGETTLLFQLVPAAAAVLRPRLSSSVRGGFLSMIDWRFTSYVMASLCAHLFFVAWLDSADFAIDASFGVLPDQLARLIVEMPDPPSIPELTEITETADAQQSDDVATNDSAPNVRPSPTRDRSPANPSTQPAPIDGARIAAEAANTAAILLVGSLDESSESAFDQLRRGATTADAQSVLDQVRGTEIAAGPAGAIRTRAGGVEVSSEVRGLGDLIARGHGATGQRPEGRAVVEVQIQYTVSEPDAPVQESGDRDPDEVVRLLRARRGAFQACYEGRTRVNPDLRGKISAEFTISEMGTVSGVRITENGTEDAPLGTCVTNVFQRLRFGEAEGSGMSRFAHAFVFAPQH